MSRLADIAAMDRADGPAVAAQRKPQDGRNRQGCRESAGIDDNPITDHINPRASLQFFVGDRRWCERYEVPVDHVGSVKPERLVAHCWPARAERARAYGRNDGLVRMTYDAVPQPFVVEEPDGLHRPVAMHPSRRTERADVAVC